MIYPNQVCYNFCVWLLTSKYYKYSSSRIALINIVKTAANTGGSVTTQQWNDFVYISSINYQAYAMQVIMQPNNSYTITLDPLTTAWLQNVSSPSQITVLAVDTFFKTCRADGNLLFDYFYLFAQDQQANSLVSLFNPTLYTATANGGYTWNAYLGFTGNGTNAYINANFIDSLNGINYTLNSGMFGVYTRNVVGASTRVCLGNDDGIVQNFIGLNFTGAGILYNCNSSTGQTTAGTNTQGLSIVTRPNASTFSVIQNGTTINTVTLTATALCTRTDAIMCWNNQGTFIYNDDNQYTCAFKGSGAIDNTKLTAAINTLMNDLGAHY